MPDHPKRTVQRAALSLEQAAWSRGDARVCGGLVPGHVAQRADVVYRPLLRRLRGSSGSLPPSLGLYGRSVPASSVGKRSGSCLCERAYALRRPTATRYANGVYERITINPNQMGGLPCIRGMRMPVTTVIGQLAAGLTHEEILADFPYLEEADIYAALEYAAATVLQGGRTPFAAG